jgi:hypothetical protein
MLLMVHYFYKSDGMDSFEVVTKKFDINACILEIAPRNRVEDHGIRIGQRTDPAAMDLIALQRRGCNDIVVVSTMMTTMTINVIDT